jgi:hypothetical protein
MPARLVKPSPTSAHAVHCAVITPGGLHGMTNATTATSTR